MVMSGTPSPPSRKPSQGDVEAVGAPVEDPDVAADDLRA